MTETIKPEALKEGDYVDPRTRLADSLAWQSALFAFAEKVAATAKRGEDACTVAEHAAFLDRFISEARALIALKRRDGVRG